LLRDVVIERLPMSRIETIELNRQAAGWLEEHGRVRHALGACLAAADPDLILEFLSRHDQRLLSEGVVDGVVRAVELVPTERRPVAIELLLTDALVARGDFDGALRALARAGGDRSELDPAVAWRAALIHHQRGISPTVNAPTTGR
jgi:ATP/maltotriose-dependent transcriptional regulator MalT